MRKDGASGSVGYDIERVISMVVGFRDLLLGPPRMGIGSLMTKDAIVGCRRGELRPAFDLERVGSGAAIVPGTLSRRMQTNCRLPAD